MPTSSQTINITAGTANAQVITFTARDNTVLRAVGAGSPDDSQVGPICWVEISMVDVNTGDAFNAIPLCSGYIAFDAHIAWTGELPVDDSIQIRVRYIPYETGFFTLGIVTDDPPKSIEAA